MLYIFLGVSIIILPLVFLIGGSVGADFWDIIKAIGVLYLIVFMIFFKRVYDGTWNTFTVKGR